jgi:histidinol dehydrogenase
VLPTAGAARTRGGLNTADFVRIISIQRMTREGFAAIAPTAVALAGTEGLVNHAQSIDIRRSSRPARREAR